MKLGKREVYAALVVILLIVILIVQESRFINPVHNEEQENIKNSLQDKDEFLIASARFEGTLENGTKTQGYLNDNDGVYWNISISDGALQGIIELECGDYDYFLKGFCNGQLIFYTERAGDTRVNIVRSPLWIGVWELHILPSHVNDFGTYNITATFNYNSIIVDGEPNVAWERKLEFTERVWPTSITKCGNDGFLVGGVFILNLTEQSSTMPQEPIEPEYEWKMFLLRIDNNGDPLWNETFGTNIRGHPKVCTLDDGSYIVADIQRGEESWKGPIYLVHVSSNGQQLWDHLIDGDGWYLRQIVPCTNGDFLVVGEYIKFANESYTEVGTVIRMANDGSEIWRFNTSFPNFCDYFSPDESEKMIALSASEAPDGRLIICGNMFPDHSRHRGWLALLDGDGSLEWGSSLDKQYATNVFVINSTTFAIVGESVEEYDCISTQYLTFDGESVNCFTYFHELDMYFREITKTVDNGFVYLLEHDARPTRRSFVAFRTDNSGNLVWYYEHTSKADPAYVATYQNGDILIIANLDSYRFESEMLLIRFTENPVTDTDIWSIEQLEEAITVGIILGIVNTSVILILLWYYKRYVKGSPVE